MGDLELSEPGGSASTDRREERVGEKPGACWNAGEEPWEGAPRRGGGGQGPAGVRALASPWASDTDLRGDFHSAGSPVVRAQGPRGRNSKQKAF